MTKSKHISIFISFSGQGGVERMVTGLASGFLDKGYLVDLVLIKKQSEHQKDIPEGVRIIDLGTNHTFTSLPALIRYLKKNQPTAMLAAKDRAIKVAVLARILSRSKTRLVGRLGTTVSAALKGRSWFKKFTWYRTMRLFYRGVDEIVAVSQGVADDIIDITGLPAERISVIRNPVWRPEMAVLAKQAIDHQWFKDSDIPVILGSGRLTRQKDFPTLIRAFAKLRKKMPCRLVILGEGQLRQPLQVLASELGISEDFALPGFVTNPYSYLAKAKLFVLSSAWEGSPNVLTEALILGVPVVSTDCPSGPIEILEKGHYGKLVAIGDVDAMALAMEETLNSPLDSALLKHAVREYTLEKSVQGYLKALGMT